MVALSPQGTRLNPQEARRLADFDRLILLSGRYEGFDERVLLGLADEELSIGDVVLTGGEVPAMAVVESVSRFVPGVLGRPGSAEDDSFCRGVLDFPQYTRPAAYRGMEVPPVLLSGDHEAIRKWRSERAVEATRTKRPDLLRRSAHEEDSCRTSFRGSRPKG